MRRIGAKARQALVAALSATANMRLLARAAGFAHSSFYRLRDRHPGFASEMGLAVRRGDWIGLALIDSFARESCCDDAWRSDDPPAIPRMSVDPALQVLYLARKRRDCGRSGPTDAADGGRIPHV